MSTALSMLGPKHHIRIMEPLAKELSKHDCQTTWYTANAEAGFEHGIQECLGDNWQWLPDYTNPVERNTTYEEMLTFFRARFATPSAVSYLLPPIVDRISYEISADVSATEKLLDAQQPDFCYALHEINRWGMLLGFWCAAKKIPFFTTQEGMYYGLPAIYQHHTRYSESYVWGEATKEKLIAAKCDPGRIHVVGHPALKSRWHHAASTKQKALDTLPDSIKAKQKALLYVANGHITGLQVEEQLKGLKDSPYALIVMNGNHCGLPQLARLHEYFDPYPDLVYIAEDEALLWHYAELCDVVGMLGVSTFGLECLWRGKPLAQVLPQDSTTNFTTDLGVAYDGFGQSIVEWITGTAALFATDAHQRHVKEWVGTEITDPNAASAICRAWTG